MLSILTVCHYCVALSCTLSIKEIKHTFPKKFETSENCLKLIGQLHVKHHKWLPALYLAFPTIKKRQMNTKLKCVKKIPTIPITWILSAIKISSHAVSIVFTWKDCVSKRVIKYSTVVRKSPRMDNSFSATTRFLWNSTINIRRVIRHKSNEGQFNVYDTYSLASSRSSPQEKQCPNWESANSWSPPEADTLK